MQCPELGASTVVNPSSNSHSSAIDSSSTSLAFATVDPPTQSFITDDGGLQTILEKDIDEEYYMFTGRGDDTMEDAYFDEPEDDSVVGSNVQDPYDRLYRTYQIACMC